MENENYNKAIEHFANGLSLIDSNCDFLIILKKKLPIKMFTKIKEQTEEIKIMLPKIQKLLSYLCFIC